MAIWRIRQPRAAVIRMPDGFVIQLPPLDGRSLLGHWPGGVGEIVGPPTDFLYLASGVMVCRNSLVRTFPAELLNELECLPLLAGKEECRVLNPIKIVDCLDATNSAVRRFPPDSDENARVQQPPGRILTIDRFAFLQQRLSAKFIFKLPGAEGILLCTNLFRTFVVERSLTGLTFSPAE